MNGRDPELAKARAQARLRRGMFLLPSLFTCGNIAAGFFSITETIKAISGDAPTHLDWAAIAIIFAIPFDALDGRIARMTNTASDFGKELDSLADAITFGVAPALLALIWGFHFLPDYRKSATPRAPAPGRRLHLLSVLDWRCFAAGALQHQPRRAAAQPGASGPEILCRDADSCGGGAGGFDGPLCRRHSSSELVGCAPLACAGGAVRVPDGEHVALLVGQGDQLLPRPSISVAVCAGDRVLRHGPVLQCGFLRHRNHVHVLGHLGAGGLRLVAAQAQRGGPLPMPTALKPNPQNCCSFTI